MGYRFRWVLVARRKGGLLEAIAQRREVALHVRVGCAFEYEFERATPAVFLVRPEDGGGHHVIREQWATLPDAIYHDYRSVRQCVQTPYAAGRQCLGALRCDGTDVVTARCR